MDDPRLEILNVRPISSWSYPRVLVGIPLERSISYASKVFFPFMKIAMKGPSMIQEPYGRIDVTRNKMVQRLLSSNFSHLLMLDIDHIHPENIVESLARWVIIDPSIKVVSGLNFRRGKPYDPVCGVYQNEEKRERMLMTEWEQGLVEVDECGGASMLIHRSVFEEMEPPWFFNVYDHVWENNWPGEDIGFSRKCAEYRIKMFVDTTTTSPHCTETVITEETFRRYMDAHPQEFEHV